MRLKSGGWRFAAGALFLGLWVAVGCYPGEIDSTSQTDVVLTFHKAGADFKVNNTISIVDSIVDIGAAAGGSSSFDHQYDSLIIARIAQNFVAMGYTVVDPATTQPDAVVMVAGITVDNYQAWTGYPWWGYWGWWGSWGYWNYSSSASSNWYYPWTPVVVTSYRSGTLFINLADPDLTPPQPGQLVSIWGAALNGMLEGTSSEILSRINTNIVQAFAQSPYLDTH